MTVREALWRVGVWACVFILWSIKVS